MAVVMVLNCVLRSARLMRDQNRLVFQAVRCGGLLAACQSDPPEAAVPLRSTRPSPSPKTRASRNLASWKSVSPTRPHLAQTSVRQTRATAFPSTRRKGASLERTGHSSLNRFSSASWTERKALCCPSPTAKLTTLVPTGATRVSSSAVAVGRRRASRGANAGSARELGHASDGFSPPQSRYCAGLDFAMCSSSAATAGLSIRPSATPMVSA